VQLPAAAGETLEGFGSEDLERTPRDYVRVVELARSPGEAKVTLVLVDALGREYPGAEVALVPGQQAKVSVDMQQVGHPLSMLRAVRMRLEGAAVELSGLRFLCGAEQVPKPDAIVQGPMDDTSIQAALDSLGEDGGVVYLPAGTYLIGNQITIPVDNVTIYGDGRATVIQGQWFEARALLVAADRDSLRLTRLHLRSLPISEFRGYNEAAHAEKPEDVGRPSVLSRASNCATATRHAWITAR